MRGEREAVERSEEGVREEWGRSEGGVREEWGRSEGGRERQDGREGGKIFSIVYLFANQVRNTPTQNMGGEEDSKKVATALDSVQGISPLHSPFRALSYFPIAIYTQVFRRTLGLRQQGQETPARGKGGNVTNAKEIKILKER